MIFDILWVDSLLFFASFALVNFAAFFFLSIMSKFRPEFPPQYIWVSFNLILIFFCWCLWFRTHGFVFSAALVALMAYFKSNPIEFLSNVWSVRGWSQESYILFHQRLFVALTFLCAFEWLISPLTARLLENVVSMLPFFLQSAFKSVLGIGAYGATCNGVETIYYWEGVYFNGDPVKPHQECIPIATLDWKHICPRYKKTIRSVQLENPELHSSLPIAFHVYPSQDGKHPPTTDWLDASCDFPHNELDEKNILLRNATLALCGPPLISREESYKLIKDIDHVDITYVNKSWVLPQCGVQFRVCSYDKVFPSCTPEKT
jgi:hypothetical protein